MPRLSGMDGTSSGGGGETLTDSVAIIPAAGEVFAGPDRPNRMMNGE
jgi:hypothetical protein